MIENNYYKTIIQHRAVYLRKPALRAVYKHWANHIRNYLSPIEGRSVELGCGCGALSRFLPQFIKTDIYRHEWIDAVVDACSMPYADNECANLVAVDVLHHLYDLSAFFDEVSRVLKYGGRLVMLEPYISPVSFMIYKYFHHEVIDAKIDPFIPMTQDEDLKGASNSALPTLVFMRHRLEFTKRWPKLKIVKIILRDAAIYPLTGGFSRRNWLPYFLVKPLMNCEDVILRYTGFLNAMRMLLVIEKTPAIE